MMSSNEQEDRKAERKKQEERARAMSAARKRNREEELRKLHVLATEVGALMGGKARSTAAGNAWMFVDLGLNLPYPDDLRRRAGLRRNAVASEGAVGVSVPIILLHAQPRFRQ
jgi:hypothetical protein